MQQIMYFFKTNSALENKIIVTCFNVSSFAVIKCSPNRKTWDEKNRD